MQADRLLTFGPYRWDPHTGQLWRGKQEVSLTGKAAAVLRYLVERAGQLVTKDELFAVVWPQTVVSDAALSSCIQELRQALGDDAKKPRYIETVHRRGFQFIGKVASSQESVGSGQQAVGSREEEKEKQQTKEENGLASSVQSQDEGVSRQHSVGSRQEEDKNTEQAEGLRLQAEGPPPSPPSSLQPEASSLSQDSALSTPDLFSPTSPRFWLDRWRVWLVGVLLVTGTLGAVWYLILPIPNPQSLTPSPQLALPDKPSLVVMPFTNMSSDPEQEYFSDGLTDDLITDLSRLSGLFIIARTSAFTYKGKAVKVQDVGKELGVQYVLEGSVRRTAERIRINAQLSDATTGRQLWAERYDRPVQELFTLQDEVVQKIVTTLQLQLTLWERGQLVRKRTNNLQAYDHYLRGQEALWHFTKETNAQAQQRFAQAIELDPQYAEAYVGLAATYNLARFYQWSQDPQVLERIFELAQKAIALDDSLSVAYEILSLFYLFKKQYEQALTTAEHAISLAPNSARGYLMLGTILNLMGQAEQAIGVLEQALRLDPRVPLPYQVPLGWAYLLTRRYDDAIATQQKSLRRNHDLLEPHLILTISYSELGREEEARAEAAEVLRLSPTYSLDVVRQTWPYKNPADMERTLAALRKAGLK